MSRGIRLRYSRFIFKYLINLDRKIYILSLIVTTTITTLFLKSVSDFYSYLITNILFGASIGVSLPFVEAIALDRLSKRNMGQLDSGVQLDL